MGTTGRFGKSNGLFRGHINSYENTDNSELFVGFMVVTGFFLFTVLVLCLCLFAFWLKRRFCSANGDQLDRSNSTLSSRDNNNIRRNHHLYSHHLHHHSQPNRVVPVAFAAAAAVVSTTQLPNQGYSQSSSRSSFHTQSQANGLGNYHLQYYPQHLPYCPQHHYDVPPPPVLGVVHQHSNSARRATIYR